MVHFRFGRIWLPDTCESAFKADSHISDWSRGGGGGGGGELIDGQTVVCHFGSCADTQKFSFLHKNPAQKFILQQFILRLQFQRGKLTGENYQFCVS